MLFWRVAVKRLIVDGMLSGTGIRDGINGGYIELEDLNISSKLMDKISQWLKKYEYAHYSQFNDITENESLDFEGLSIANLLKNESPEFDVKYFSNATMKYIDL